MDSQVTLSPSFQIDSRLTGISFHLLLAVHSSLIPRDPSHHHFYSQGQARRGASWKQSDNGVQ